VPNIGQLIVDFEADITDRFSAGAAFRFED